MFLLPVLVAALADIAAVDQARAARQELGQRLGAAPATGRGDFAGRIRFVLAQTRNNPIVQIDVLDLVCNALREGLLPERDWTSPWPEGLFPEPFRKALGDTFPNPGVYSVLGELLPWFATQFAERARVLRAEGVAPYQTLVWSPTRRAWRQTSDRTEVETASGVEGVRWSSDVLNARPEGWAIWPYEFFYPDLFSVLDWVRATHPTLQGMGIREAFARAKTWHAALPMERTENGLSRGVVVAAWPDGATIERLLTRENLRDEGKAMGHCIANYADAATSGSRLYFTYRDKHGTSYASWEMDLGAGFGPDGWRTPPALVQLQGPRNGPIDSSTVQHRLAAWLVQNKVPLAGAGDRLASVPGFDARPPPLVLPLSTLPEEIRVENEKRDPVLFSFARQAALVTADTAKWTPQEQAAATQLAEADEEVRIEADRVEEMNDLLGQLMSDRDTESLQERLRVALEDGLEAGLAAVVSPVDVDDATVLRDMARQLGEKKKDGPIAFPEWTGTLGSLQSALSARANRIDLLDHLRAIDWFADEDEANFDPSDAVSRAEWDASDALDSLGAALERFLEVWRTSPITEEVWQEVQDWGNRSGGRIWVFSPVLYDGDKTSTPRLKYDYGDGESKPFLAAAAGRTFSRRSTSPLAALWRAGVVYSKAEAEADAARRKEAQAGLSAYAPSFTLSPVTTLATSPKGTVEAARAMGQVVPYAILRQVGVDR